MRSYHNYRPSWPPSERSKTLNANNEQIIIKSVVDVMQHVRSIMAREKHLDCRSERVGQFIVSLRRELSSKGLRHFSNELCDRRDWIDAGIPKSHTHVAEKYGKLMEVAMTVAGNRSETQLKLKELDAMVNMEQQLAEQAKSINNEADKLLESFENLASNM
jgi:urease gamma subunit